MEETIDLDWYLNSQNLNYGTPVPPTPGSSSATQHAEENAGPRRHTSLPLLRRSDWEKERSYDINNPVCIHYDIQWKVSQYNGQKKRASEVWRRQERNLVLAPGDYWEECLRGKIDDFVNEKLGENNYMREEANLTISIKNSRGHGFKEEYHDKPIDWDEVNDHLAGLGHLFEKEERSVSISTLPTEKLFATPHRPIIEARKERYLRGVGKKWKRRRAFIAVFIKNFDAMVGTASQGHTAPSMHKATISS